MHAIRANIIVLWIIVLDIFSLQMPLVATGTIKFITPDLQRVHRLERYSRQDLGAILAKVQRLARYDKRRIYKIPTSRVL